jgi:WD40 repeat protein
MRQFALSTCPALTTVSSETAVPGAAIAVSADGRFLATWIHTTDGADLTVRNRDTGAAHRIELPAQIVPPGMTWHVLQARFSPDSRLLVVGALGRVWVAEPSTGRLLYSIGVSGDGGLWPASFAISNDRLGVIFWPPQSALRDVPSKQATLLDFYDLPTGRGLRAIPLETHTSSAWATAELSPDDQWLLLLERARTWPGRAHLTLLDAASGQPVWKKSYPVEDARWSADTGSLVALGGRLIWLSAKNGQILRESGSDAGASEFQRLRFNEISGAALGLFSRYSLWQRLFTRHTEESALVVLWRMDTGQELCRVQLSPRTAVDGWPTSRGEIITLEETYAPRSPTPRPQSAHIVTYKLAASPPLHPSSPPIGAHPRRPGNSSPRKARIYDK